MTYSVYQPSGTVPGLAMPLAAVLLAASLPLAALYAWLGFHLPGILDLFICFTFAYVVGSLAKRVGAKAKVRNPRWLGRYGLLLGLCGWYVQWAVWALLQRDADSGFFSILSDAPQMVFAPSMVFATALDVLQSTTSTLAGLPLEYLVVLSWLGELGVLLFGPHDIARMRAREVFDENEGRWADYVELPGRYELIDQPGLQRVLGSPSGRLSDLLVPHPGPVTAPHARLRVYGSTTPQALVSVVSVEMDNKGGRRRSIECSPGLYFYVPQSELETLAAGQQDAGVTDADTDTDTETETDPPELVLAIEHMQAGRFEQAYQEALPFVAASERQLYCDANRICAIACSESRQWAQANAYWESLFAREATAHNALQVATSAIMAGAITQAQEWIGRARTLNASTQEMPAVTMLTNVISALTAAQQFEAALFYLGQLRDFYTALQVTDPTFLFAHRMPMFHMFLEKSGAVVNRVLDRDASRAWYAAMLPHLDERGQAELTDWLAAARSPV